MDGIEFGQVEFREPESELRPDRNRKFAVVGCGEVDQSQLPIFVDLDVMRDMEGHARTNTHVELGGILLGGKFVDEEGRSFVVVQEALRAEHYEATRGSFKFTHETWSQFARDREELPEDLHLVGWYHTHPDWGVFLSGMDTFICDNFFADDLDVDLVIDPCRGDRGWFFWEQVGGARKKTRVSGFYLFTNRYRRSELLQFANALATVNPAYFDPRYESPMGESTMQPVVNIHDQKSPTLMIAVLGMLTIQMLVLGLIAWRLLFPPAMVTPLAQQQRNEVYREILGQLVSGESTDGKDIIKRVEEMTVENVNMQTDLEGRGLLIQDLKSDQSQLKRKVESQSETLEKRSDVIVKRDIEIEDLEKQLKDEKQLNGDIKDGKSIGGYKWPIVTAIGIGTALLGLFSGTFIGRRFSENDDFYSDRSSSGVSQKPLADPDTGTQSNTSENPERESQIPDMTIRDDDEQQD